MIANTYHISETFITDGIQELRQKNLLAVGYDRMDPNHWSRRLANVYTPLDLYDPVQLQKELKTHESSYGKDRLDRAVQNASAVFGENHPQLIRTLIELETSYGRRTVDEAARKIASKKSDNPKRSAAYLINTIKSIANGG